MTKIQKLILILLYFEIKKASLFKFTVFMARVKEQQIVTEGNSLVSNGFVAYSSKEEPYGIHITKKGANYIEKLSSSEILSELYTQDITSRFFLFSNNICNIIKCLYFDWGLSVSDRAFILSFDYPIIYDRVVIVNCFLNLEWIYGTNTK